MWKLFNKLVNLFQPEPITQRATYLVPKVANGGRRLVIPDIHGCAKTFRKLVEDINLQKEDQLFLLGDYINKGPNSLDVLEFIFELQKQKYRLFPLVGNHEIMLLEANRSKYILKSFTRKYQTERLVNPRTEKVRDEFVRFIQGLPYYFMLEDYLLVHAGFNFAAFDPFQDFEAMLYIRDFPVEVNYLQGRQILHGHNPKALNIVEQHIQGKLPQIPLDNGCVYHGRRPNQGNLLCFNLDTQELIVKENIDELSNI